MDLSFERRIIGPVINHNIPFSDIESQNTLNQNLLELANDIEIIPEE